MLAAVVLVAIVYAVTAPGTTPALRDYLHVQIFGTLALYGSLLFVEETSTAYLVIFCAVTLAVLATAGILAFKSLMSHDTPLLVMACAILLGVIFGILALRDSRELEVYDYMAMAESSVLVMAGVLVGYASPYLTGPRRTVAFTLAMLWFCQAGYRIGFALHATSPTWLDANEFVPAALPAVAYVWLGWKLRMV